MEKGREERERERVQYIQGEEREGGKLEGTRRGKVRGYAEGEEERVRRGEGE